MGSSSSCLSAGADNDPGSGTKAVEILPCDAKSTKQQWVFNKDDNMYLKSDSSKCIDFDRTDRMAEMYGCGNRQINQRWTWDSKTGRITSVMDASCMTAAKVTESLHPYSD